MYRTWNAVPPAGPEELVAAPAAAAPGGAEPVRHQRGGPGVRTRPWSGAEIETVRCPYAAEGPVSGGDLERGADRGLQ
ncbi:hypothetical protein GCM10009677_57010 [Sphaerisporangium rubeum]